MRIRSAVAVPAILAAMSAAGGEVYPAKPEASVAEVFARVHTAVVTLYTEGETGLRDAQGVAETQSDQGSGVLLSEGRILTAAHVVHTADTVMVRYLDGTRARARVTASAFGGDVALLQVDEPPPPRIVPAVLGDSDRVAIGSVCLIIGAPLGLTHTLTVGHVSARRSRAHPTQDLLDVEYFQTDASLNPGNSGGPMFDM
jgi:S1-C subfamily serine protease